MLFAMTIRGTINFSNEQLTDAKIKQAACMANLASLYQPNPCNLHGIQMSYVQNKLLLSISLQSF